MIKKLLNPILLLLVLISSCGPKSFEQEEFIEYVTDVENGYKQEKQYGNVKYSLQYRPTDWLVSQSLINTDNQLEIDSLRKHYGNYLYFTLNTSRNGRSLLGDMSEGRDGFSKRVSQLSFGMQNHIFLLTNKKDTLTIADYHSPRFFGMSNSSSTIFVFKKDKLTDNVDWLKFKINDMNLGTGNVSFKIDKEKIDRQPEIKF